MVKTYHFMSGVKPAEPLTNFIPQSANAALTYQALLDMIKAAEAVVSGPYPAPRSQWPTVRLMYKPCVWSDNGTDWFSLSHTTYHIISDLGNDLYEMEVDPSIVNRLHLEVVK